MKILFSLFLIIIFNHISFAENLKICSFYLKSSPSVQRRLPLLEMSKKEIIVFYKNNRKRIKLEDLIDLKIEIKNSNNRYPLIVTKNKNIFGGNFLYMDSKKVNIEIKKEILSIPLENIEYYIDSDLFLEDQKKTALKSMQFSLLCPGLGQIYSNRKYKGYFLALSFSATAFSAFYCHEKYKDQKELYKESKFKKNSYYVKSKKYQTASYVFASLATFVYFFNIYDSYFNFSLQFSNKDYNFIGIEFKKNI